MHCTTKEVVERLFGGWGMKNRFKLKDLQNILVLAGIGAVVYFLCPQQLFGDSLSNPNLPQPLRESIYFRDLFIILFSLSLFVTLRSTWRYLKKIWVDPIKKINALLHLHQEKPEALHDISFSEEVGIEISELAQSVSSLSKVLKDEVFAKRYINSILHAMADILIVLDQNGNIEIVNATTLKVLGYQEDELLGKPIETLLENGLRLRKTLAGEDEKVSEKFLLKKNGKKLPILFSTSVIESEEHVHSHIICVAQDITERNKFYEMLKVQTWELAHKNEELKHLGLIKDELLAASAKDLRSPLTIIKAAAEMLKEREKGDFTREQKKCVTLINNTAARVIKAINTRLDANKVDMQKKEVRIKEIESTKVLAQVCENFSLITLSKDISFESKYDEKLPYLFADEEALEHALTSLFDYALQKATSHITLQAMTKRNFIVFKVLFDDATKENQETEAKVLQDCEEILKLHHVKTFQENISEKTKAIGFALPQYGNTAQDLKLQNKAEEENRLGLLLP